ncbi:N-acetyl-gamma-glutamyl-phosphate reductase [Gammaproteobacteria bacterium AH-315-M22]|nr:N-acetyl-gamma-glutamyl-phosphate reductase [Gammaproteobacteria bacterium AH-315-M22]
MIKVGVVGATGYTGVELLRLLSAHPGVEITVVTSRGKVGRPVTDLFTNLRGYIDLRFIAPDLDDLTECDLVFFATPNGIAMTMVPELLDAGVKVIDLAADFRLQDADEWQHWYKMEHACPDLLDEAVYGLPEINREQIVDARLIANPGCYPTSVQLGFLPLIEQGLVDAEHLIADVKSGVSGAGRKAALPILLAEASENMKAYNVDGHRHLPEIRQGLGTVSDNPIRLTFVPHLTPMIRGIHATLYADLVVDEVDLQELYEEYYIDEPFVDVLPLGVSAETRSVRGSNCCRISVYRPQDGDVVVVTSVIDNLVKGAAGQAVQNMNIMFDFDETCGLEGIAIIP